MSEQIAVHSLNNLFRFMKARRRRWKRRAREWRCKNRKIGKLDVINNVFIIICVYVRNK